MTKSLKEHTDKKMPTATQNLFEFSQRRPLFEVLKVPSQYIKLAYIFTRYTLNEVHNYLDHTYRSRENIEEQKDSFIPLLLKHVDTFRAYTPEQMLDYFHGLYHHHLKILGQDLQGADAEKAGLQSQIALKKKEIVALKSIHTIYSKENIPRTPPNTWDANEVKSLLQAFAMTAGVKERQKGILSLEGKIESIKKTEALYFRELDVLNDAHKYFTARMKEEPTTQIEARMFHSA